METGDRKAYCDLLNTSKKNDAKITMQVLYEHLKSMSFSDQSEDSSEIYIDFIINIGGIQIIFDKEITDGEII